MYTKIVKIFIGLLITFCIVWVSISQGNRVCFCSTALLDTRYPCLFQCRESRIFTISQRFYITNIKTEISSLWRCPHLHLLPIMENLPHHYHRHPSPPQHLLVTHLQSRLTPPPLESQGVVNRAVNKPSLSVGGLYLYLLMRDIAVDWISSTSACPSSRMCRHLANCTPS